MQSNFKFSLYFFFFVWQSENLHKTVKCHRAKHPISNCHMSKGWYCSTLACNDNNPKYIWFISTVFCKQGNVGIKTFMIWQQDKRTVSQIEAWRMTAVFWLFCTFSEHKVEKWGVCWFLSHHVRQQHHYNNSKRKGCKMHCCETIKGPEIWW